MPIYEFKCLQCNDLFEILVRNQEEEAELCCPKCRATEFERVLSATSHAMGESKGAGGPSAVSRNCASGSCTTYTVPGHSR